MFGGGVFGGGGGLFGEFGAQDAEAGDAAASRPHVTTASILADSPHSQAQGYFVRQKAQSAALPDPYAIVSAPVPSPRAAVRRGAVVPPRRPALPRAASPRSVKPGMLSRETSPTRGQRSPTTARPIVKAPAAPTYTGWKPPAVATLPAQLIPRHVPPLHGFGEDAAPASSTGAKVVLIFAAIGVLAVGARLLDL
jgi:hypothetical protein